MADKHWGNCKNCRYFSSRAAQPEADERARCMQPELQDFDLIVFGASGCNAFELRVGLTEESSEQPPA
jgi:hypothetical protein